MILIDRALQQREQADNPVRIAMVGAGFMGRGIALQIQNRVPGMELVAICNRSLQGATHAYREAGVEGASNVETSAQLDANIEAGAYSVTTEPSVVCAAGNVDAILEVTGTIEFGAQVATNAIREGKHILVMNAELDATVGPILKHHADQADVIYSNTDGDQPGVIMNLCRYARGMGFDPILCGNIKGLQDRFRNPTTQEGFARQWKQQAHMVTSFADGTKISFEQAIVANATGMRVARRGMCGPDVPTGTSIREAASWYPEEYLCAPGIVDYVVGADPAPGVFVLAMENDPLQQHYLAYYKLGDGPYYCFYHPYHLCHLEVPMTLARAVLFHDATVAPDFGPCVDVVATAKENLKAGRTLDGIGYYLTYGQAENSDVCRSEGLLPMGLAEGAILKRDIPVDTTLTLADVELPKGRLIDRLRQEQDECMDPGSGLVHPRNSGDNSGAGERLVAGREVSSRAPVFPSA